MEKEKIAIIAKKIEALAIGFIGVCFFSWGTSYFQERFIYRMPRILEPVFNLFGGIGLAIGLLILGAGVIFWGFVRWKVLAENKKLYWILAVIALCIGSFCANYEFNPNKSADMEAKMEQNRQKQLDQIAKAEKPVLNNNAEVNKHLTDFGQMYKRYETAIEAQNEEEIIACNQAFVQWSSQWGNIMQALSNDEKQVLSSYVAKLQIRWGELTQKSK